jgi:hypothetical protein
LPEWSKVWACLTTTSPPRTDYVQPAPTWKKKHAEIPRLQDYTEKPSNNFWSVFPSNFPTKTCLKVDAGKQEILVRKHAVNWTEIEKQSAKKAIKRLRGDLPIELKKDLPGLVEKNAKSAFENGEQITDTLADWVKKGFVAGPFDSPPTKKFRANPLMAVVQRTKVRPILNLSLPTGRSFNDTVITTRIDKLKMTSAKKFAELLLAAGEGALIAKPDIQDAYKLIPNPKEQWGMYGFSWLGKFFYDTTTVFESAAAPASFDPLPETAVNLACTLSKVPKKWITRQLDDVPIVSPKGSKLTEKFYKTYKEICADLGIPLAEECPQKEKAFKPTTKGTVLGLIFNSENLSWSINKEKVNSILHILNTFLKGRTCTLSDAQILHGKLSDFAQACTFMKGFRFNLLELLKKFENDNNSKKFIPSNLKADLNIWKNFVKQAEVGFPLATTIENPPLFPVTFVTDAAGASWEWTEKGRINTTKPGDRGAAAIEHNEGQITFIATIRWPDSLMFSSRSSNNLRLGSKSTTLETVGILLPFLTKPKDLAGRHILIEVDNTAVVFAWEKRYSKTDPETSLLIRCLHVIEARLECKVFVKHLKRRSNQWATLADDLSRESTITESIAKSIAHISIQQPTGPICDWLNRPALDWNLPVKIVQHLDNLLNPN